MSLEAVRDAATPFADHLLRSRAAQASWASLRVAARLRPVRRFRAALVSDPDVLTAAVHRDIGKSPAEALAGEILPLAAAAQYLERRAARLLRPRRVSWRDTPPWLWGQTDKVHRRPRGVVGIIGTWNFPLFLNGVQILQALVAGNGVLWKPSEVAPASARALEAALREAGFPPDLLCVLPATREAGRQLAQLPVDHLVFTGHADTGRILAAELGRRLVSSTLELSGCDVFVVLPDADLDLASRAAWFGMTVNAGQTCIASRRVFVARSVAEEFTKRLWALGLGAKPVPLALPSQAVLARQLIRDALAEGARLVTPERLDDRQAFTPVVLADVRPAMGVWREATFVPVLGITTYDRPEEVLRDQHGSPYALGAAVFGGDVARARDLAARLRAGMVAINDVVAPMGHPATPFGGWGASGWGVTQGAEGLLEMTVPQVLSVRRGTFRPHYDPPGSTRLTGVKALKSILALSHAVSWRERVRAAWTLIWDRDPGLGGSPPVQNNGRTS
jgi:acyl-CoA reductase-like NAD-dependent aldehyde dehydrogenase